MRLTAVCFLLAGTGVAIAAEAPQAGAPVVRTGCLVQKGGRFLLRDNASNAVIELRGPDLELNLGNHVEITGKFDAAAPSIAPATEAIAVTSVSPRSPGGCLTAAALLDAKTRMPDAPQRQKK